MAAWLRVFLPLAALVGGVYATLLHYESRAARAAFVSQQQTRLQLAEEHLAGTLHAAATDLRVIAATPALDRFLAGADQGRALIEDLFVAFVAQNPLYHQLRLIDADGQEVVRVRSATEGPKVAAVGELQSKRGRDYVVETLQLLPGLVRAARLDLNVEHGVVEQPLRSVLRLSTRIRREGQADHVLVVNLRGELLLQDLRERADAPGTQTWLLDEEGYWLLHPDPRLRWGRQLDARQRLGLLLPMLADTLRAAEGSVQIDADLYVHRRLNLQLRHGAGDPFLQGPGYALVSLSPADAHAARNGAGRIAILVAGLLILALGSAVLVRFRARAAAAERRETQLLREQAATGEARAWIRDRSYELSLAIHASDAPEDFARAVLAQLAPALDLAAACLYRVQADRATALASWGLGSAPSLRGFDAGHGLVGEVLRTQTALSLRPAPAGYLDLHGALGAAAPAEIRLLPLDVHGHTVGVLELALTRALVPREEEFLRSVLPLLALNLDGFLGRRAS